MKSIRAVFIVLALIASPLLASGQPKVPSSESPSASTREDGIGLAPTRLELPMLPGTEKTVLVNIYYNAVSEDARPSRLVAYLGDWSILSNGETEYYRAGARPDSACSWMIYSPSEMVAMPGKVHPIRVTISVPADAAPGDHLAALFVEARPNNIKAERDSRQVILKFRMAALFYIMVPDLTRKGSLEDLRAEASEHAVVVTPTLKNYGNTHIRPIHRVRILDSANAVVAEMAESESLPVLGNSELSRPLLLEKILPPGIYSVQYRVDFKDGGEVTEGQTDLIVKEALAQNKWQNLSH